MGIYIFIEMKYTSALVIAALLGAAFVGESQAVQLKTRYTDDLIKSLTEDMQKEAETGESAEATEEAKPVEKKVEKKAPKKQEKKRSPQLRVRTLSTQRDIEPFMPTQYQLPME